MFKAKQDAETRLADKTYSNAGNDKVVALVEQFGGGKGHCLDLGCGAGGNAALLVRRGWVVDGITISDTEAGMARSFCRKVEVHDLEGGLPSSVGQEPYDAILASHILEHVFYPEKLLCDCWRVLKPSGGMVISLPNLLYWKNRVKMALGSFEYQDVGIMDYTHCRWYTFRTAQALLEKHGFKILEAIADGDLLAGRSLPGFLRRRFHRVDDVIRRVAPGLVGFQMHFVAQKPEPGATICAPGSR